jgi:tRNA pseudouridine38-40 synthase
VDETAGAPGRVLKLTVQYDGTDHVGWQRQAEGSSIQGALEDALAAFEGQPVTVNGAGRTDAGVHALAQVASVRIHAAHHVDSIQRGLNAVLPASIRVTRVEDAPAAFHARFDAAAKTYEYRIVNAPFVSPFLCRYAWHVPRPLDPDAMRRAAEALVGRHDFAAFQGTGSDVLHCVRTVESIDWEEGRGPDTPLVLAITADGFLRHMVRSIAGTLVDIGLGRWPPAEAGEILSSRERVRAGRTAPPHGLFLRHVRY